MNILSETILISMVPYEPPKKMVLWFWLSYIFYIIISLGKKNWNSSRMKAYFFEFLTPYEHDQWVSAALLTLQLMYVWLTEIH